MSNHHYEAIKHHIIILVLNKGTLYLTATSSCRTPEEGAAHFTISQQKNQNKNGELLGIYANIFRTEQPLQFLPPRPPVSSFGSLADAARTPNQSMQR